MPLLRDEKSYQKTVNPQTILSLPEIAGQYVKYTHNVQRKHLHKLINDIRYQFSRKNIFRILRHSTESSKATTNLIIIKT